MGKKPFSTEPCNLTNRNAQRYNGLVMGTKRSKNAFRPAKAMVATTMKAGPRRSLHKAKAVLNKQRYRKDLTKAAMRRAALIARSQKPLPARKGVKAPAKKD